MAPSCSRYRCWLVGADIRRVCDDTPPEEVRNWPIVLKNSFSPVIENFSEPLVRLTRFDARDHINHRKNARWRSYRFYMALQLLNSPTCNICEILKPRDFRVFQHNRPI
jgi:hypothetical protein